MVKIRTRLLITLLLFCGLGLYLLFQNFQKDILPRYKETMEESLVDMSVLLAAQVSREIADSGIPVERLRAAFKDAKERLFTAKIYEMTKTQINLRVYITDENGIVLYDSDGGKDEGEDYSQWNDVQRTLNGEYGARSSRSDPDDPRTSLLCVAAPIKHGDEIVGVLSVCKPTESILVFLERTQRDITLLGAIAAIALLLIALMTSFWVTWPIEKLTYYVRAIHGGKRVSLPRLGHNEIGALGEAFEQMRVALEGKKYVEEYVQALTHQMKSPLSAIRGAAELLAEGMPPEQQQRFMENIRTESLRLQDIIERMLQLSVLENCRCLQDVKTVNMATLLSSVIEEMGPIFSGKGIHVQFHDASVASISCDPFLIRQAVSCLFQNAVDFSKNNGSIEVSVKEEPEQIIIEIKDDGYGIPAYAHDKVFDRFYSLQRPDNGKKSSGLGLAFVREVAALHGGEATVVNNPDGGVTATLVLPLFPPDAVC